MKRKLKPKQVVGRKMKAGGDFSLKVVKTNGKTGKKQKLPKTKEVRAIRSKNRAVECDLPLDDVRVNAAACLRWILDPIDKEVFFDEYWEKKPLLISRDGEARYSGIFSTAEFDTILRKEMIMFSKNLDVTSYGEAGRETHNPDGRAHAAVVWDYFRNGCSLRLLNPQTYSKATWRLCSVLQEYFGCLVGANVYLTPADTQGFAPHYDDIEAFLLQLEGEKEWRVYKPRDGEELPRVSSSNLSDPDEEPYLSTVLRAGDLLYMPRGWVHQGRAVPGQHSLHITVSCYQHTSWADLLEKMVPVALQRAIDDNVEFRRGLPVGYLDYMGLVHDEPQTERSEFRKQFISEAKRLVNQLVEYLPIDAAADQMAKHFLTEALPPALRPDETLRTVRNDGERWQGGEVKGRAVIDSDTRVKLIRPNAVRLVSEGDQLQLLYSVDNSRVYGESGEQSLDIDEENQAEAIATLVRAYPNYTPVSDVIPNLPEQEQVAFVSSLWERGLLITESPLFES